MQTVAIVDGVKIQFYAREHNLPHFHAVFAEYRASVSIDSISLLNGRLPPAKMDSVLAWAGPRQAVLQMAWDDVQNGRKPEKIA